MLYTYIYMRCNDPKLIYEIKILIYIFQIFDQLKIKKLCKYKL